MKRKCPILPAISVFFSNRFMHCCFKNVRDIVAELDATEIVGLPVLVLCAQNVICDLVKISARIS